jgi:hypothetical protein
MEARSALTLSMPEQCWHKTQSNYRKVNVFGGGLHVANERSCEGFAQLRKHHGVLDRDQ